MQHHQKFHTTQTLIGYFGSGFGTGNVVGSQHRMKDLPAF